MDVKSELACFRLTSQRHDHQSRLSFDLHKHFFIFTLTCFDGFSFEEPLRRCFDTKRKVVCCCCNPQTNVTTGNSNGFVFRSLIFPSTLSVVDSFFDVLFPSSCCRWYLNGTHTSYTRQSFVFPSVNQSGKRIPFTPRVYVTSSGLKSLLKEI